MSQVLRSQFSAIDPGVDFVANSIKARPQCGGNGRGRGQYHSEACTKDTGPSTSAEQRCSESEIGETIAVRLWNAFDHSMQTQAPQMVGHLALRNSFDR